MSQLSDGNMALHTLLSPELALQNRERFLMTKQLSLNDVVAMQQTHGSHIELVASGDRGRGAREVGSAFQSTDGLITKDKGVVLLVMGADCPLSVYWDPEQGVVGVTHSGWKGVVAGIVPKMLAIMQNQFGSRMENILVGVSPAADSCCYEIGQDLIKEFSDYPGNIMRTNDDGKIMLNLKNAIKWQLINAGVFENHIELSQECTICDDRWFSFRRQKDAAGRFGLFAWMK